MDSNIINIRTTIGAMLNTRDEACRLFDIAKQLSTQTQIITFDFEGVDFMSRSFADEFYKISRQTEQIANSSIVVINTELQIAKILQAVSRSQNSADRKINNKRTILTFTSNDRLSDYLMSV